MRRTRERTRKKNRAESFSERKNQRVRGFLGGGKEEQVGLERVLWQLQELSEQARPLKRKRGGRREKREESSKFLQRKVYIA